MLLAPLLLAAAFVAPVAGQTDPQPEPVNPPAASSAGATDGEAESSPLAAASQEHLWVVRRKATGKFTILHRTPDTAKNTLYRVFESTGRPVAAAADEQTLYIVYSDRSVTSLRYERGENRLGGSPLRTTRLAPLPKGGRLIELIAGRRGPIALIRREASEADGSPPPQPSEASPDASPPAPNAQTPAPDTSNNPEAADPDPSSEETAPSSRDQSAPPSLQLLRLERNVWRPIDIPARVAPGRVRALSMIDPARHRFALISEPEKDNEGLRVDEFDGEAWTRRSYALTLHPAAQAMGLRKDLFLIQPGGEDANRLLARDLRNGNVHDAGTFGPFESAVEWWGLPYADQITLLLSDAEGRLTWTQGDTSPETEPPAPQSLEVADPPSAVPDPMQLVIVGAIILAMLLLFGTVRGDPEAVAPQLPEGMRPAGLNRAAAGAFDLAVSIGVAMLIFRMTNPADLLTHWPGATPEWTQTIPALVAIAIHSAHTTLGEMLTGATLGKGLFGCRVVDLTGRSPRFWQVLVRGLLKMIELAAPLLLAMPLLSAHRQRVGDLVGRTVVVQKQAAPPVEEEA